MGKANSCYCKNLKSYPHDGIGKITRYNAPDEIFPVDKKVTDCVCSYMDRYVDFASRRLSNTELTKFYADTTDLWWESISEHPIAPETTLDAVQQLLHKNLHIADLIMNTSPDPDKVDRMDMVEIIDAFFNLAHGSDAHQIVSPCFKRNDIPKDSDSNFCLKEMAVEALYCLFKGDANQSSTK